MMKECKVDKYTVRPNKIHELLKMSSDELEARNNELIKKGLAMSSVKPKRLIDYINQIHDLKLGHLADYFAYLFENYLPEEQFLEVSKLLLNIDDEMCKENTLNS